MERYIITIDLTRLSNIPDSRHIFGNFIKEGFGRQTDGIWAEMLYNRSFRAIPPLKRTVWQAINFGPELYRADAPFWHSGYEENDWELVGPTSATMARTLGKDSLKGKDSLEVTSQDPLSFAGIRQHSIHVVAGGEYVLSLFGGYEGNKASIAPPGYSGADYPALDIRKVEVLLESCVGTGRALFSTEFDFEAQQKRFDAAFTVEGYTGKAILTIRFRWRGALLLSWASLMPHSNVSGMRESVVSLLKEVGPTVLRFPGGCFASFFDWWEWARPRSERVPAESYYWGGLDEMDFGLDEFLDLCHAIRAERRSASI